MSKFVLTVFLLLASNSVLANDWHQCFEQAEVQYKLPKNILKAIAKVESNFNPNAHNKNNKDGSEDIGVMQINSYHFKTLSKYGINRESLWNPCTNIQVGAWVLWGNIKRFGWNWEAVGAYNAQSKDKREAYVSKVAKAWKSM